MWYVLRRLGAAALIVASAQSQLGGQTLAFRADSVNRAWLVEASGAMSLPGGHMAERFGMNGLAGLGLAWKSGRNEVFDIEGRLLFGGKIKEDTVLRHITTDSGYVIGLDGLLYEPFVYERGFILSAGFGKIIPVSARYPNAGIFLGLRAIFLQHKILFSLRPEENFPQLDSEMRKGYDRMTNGLGLSEEVGWHHMSRSGLINFRVALELTQALTRNRRAVNFDTMLPDIQRRLDLLYSLKVTWMLPIWVRSKDEVIRYH
jgi:hypothetical protein